MLVNQEAKAVKVLDVACLESYDFEQVSHRA